MKTLYLDCSMGAAGDMLTAALLELLPDPNAFIEELNALDWHNVRFVREASEKCGIRGTHISVLIDGAEEEEAHHSHNTLHGIEHCLSHLRLPQAISGDVLAVYRLIADAESRVHGVPVENIHFHEVGTMDALADITAVCLLMRRLKPERVLASPVHVGCGQVRCAHGILPVPAPATAEILRGIPIYGGEIKGELCTPTGAALLKYFVHEFVSMPTMTVDKIGYGMGKKDFPAANCVRAILGDQAQQAEHILELSCNIDDMSAEGIAFAMDILLENGALDVYTVPIGMKKSRPGTMLCVLCRPEDKNSMLPLLFKHTTSLGIRETEHPRYTLKRDIVRVQSPYGELRRKDSHGYGVTRSKYEYEDLCKIAKAQNLTIAEVLDQIQKDKPK